MSDEQSQPVGMNQTAAELPTTPKKKAKKASRNEPSGSGDASLAVRHIGVQTEEMRDAILEVDESRRRSDAESRALAVAFCHHRSQIRKALAATQRSQIPPLLLAAVLALSEDVRGEPLISSAMGVGSSRDVSETQPRHSLVAVDYDPQSMERHSAPLDKTTFTPQYKERLAEAHKHKVAGDHLSEILVLSTLLSTLRNDIIPDPATTCRVLCALGEAYRKVRNLSAAEEVFFDWFLLAEKAHLDSDSIKALTQLGQVRFDQGDFAGAEKWYTQAAERANTRRITSPS